MITVENLTKYYGDFCAVNGINLSIDSREIVGLLGPNGAGKTTTLRMLTGFMAPTEGTIRVKDYSVPDDSVEIKRMIGYLPESAPLYNDMLVYDYLMYVASVREMDKKTAIARLKQLSDICGLHAIMHLAIGELSKGLKQRVGIAHAMMSDPEILVLDEPTSGLDPNQIVEIRSIIREIGREKTVILSTHVLTEVEATCDRVVIINKGKIIADEGTEALRQSVSDTQDILLTLRNADYNAVADAFGDIDGVRKIERISMTGKGELAVRVQGSASVDVREVLYERIKKREWILIEFRQERKTLEKIFQELTKEN